MSAKPRAQWIYVAMAACLIAGAVATSADAAPQRAERFHAAQIAAPDVVLDSPEVQIVLQNDMFHKMLAEMSFGEAIERSFYAPYDAAEAGALGQAWRPYAQALQRVSGFDAQSLQRLIGIDARALQRISGVQAVSVTGS